MDAAAYNEKYIKALEKQNKSLTARIQELEQERDGRNEPQEIARVELACYEDWVKQLQDRVEVSRQTIGMLRNDNARLRKSFRELDDRYQKLLAKVQGDLIKPGDAMVTAGNCWEQPQ